MKDRYIFLKHESKYMPKIAEQNTNVHVSNAAVIWVCCTMIAAISYLAKFDIGVLGAICWSVFVGGIVLCVLKFGLKYW